MNKWRKRRKSEKKGMKLSRYELSLTWKNPVQFRLWFCREIIPFVPCRSYGPKLTACVGNKQILSGKKGKKDSRIIVLIWFWDSLNENLKKEILLTLTICRNIYSVLPCSLLCSANCTPPLKHSDMGLVYLNIKYTFKLHMQFLRLTHFSRWNETSN